MIKCISFLGAPKVLSWFCQFVFNFFFARRHSLMWNISQGCTTGMPAPMLAPPSATSAVTASQGSLLMASPVKVGAHFLCLHFAFYQLYLSQLCICESLFNYGCHILSMPPICLLILRSLFYSWETWALFFCIRAYLQLQLQLQTTNDLAQRAKEMTSTSAFCQSSADEWSLLLFLRVCVCVCVRNLDTWLSISDKVLLC